MSATIKKLNKILSKIRNNLDKKKYICQEDRQKLMNLVNETIESVETSDQEILKEARSHFPPINDDKKTNKNRENLTTEQQQRLNLTEKTNAGSKSVH